MKNVLVFIAMFMSWTFSYAQLEINIDLKSSALAEISVKQNGVVIDSNKTVNLSDKGNKLSVIKTNDNNDCQIILKAGGADGQVPYTIIFRKDIGIPLTGINFERTFDKNEKLSWASSQIFSLPCIINVKNKDGKDIGNRTIKGDTADNGRKPTVLNKIFTGIPYYDAISLASCQKITINDFLEILNYYNGGKQYKVPDTLLKQFKSNRFLNEILLQKINGNCYNKVTESGKDFVFQKAISSIGGLDVTNYADGIAKFLVGRMKEELSVAFFEKFKETLNNDKYPELKVLFPQTSKNLLTIDKDIYQFSSFINVLRESFIKDLNNGYINIQALLNLQKYKDYFDNKQPEMGSVFTCSFAIINDLSKGKHPGEVLADFNTSKIILCKPGSCADNLKIQNTLRASIQTLQLISSSMRSLSKTNYWVPADSVQMLIGDPVAFKIYLGLLYQEVVNKPIIFDDKVSLTSMLDSLAEHYDSYSGSINRYKEFILAFVDKAQEVNDNITELRAKKKSEIDFNEYYNLFNSSLDLFEQSANFLDLPYVKFNDPTIKDRIKNTASKIIYVSRSSGELFVDVKTKNYSSAIINTVSILDTLLNFDDAFNKNTMEKEYISKLKSFTSDTLMNSGTREELGKQIEKININVFGSQQLQWASIKSAFVNNAKIPEKIVNSNEIQNRILEIINLRINYETASTKDQVRKYLLKYGSFIANVAQAQNSDDVKNAIESIALPTGSYSVKRNSKFNIALNGYMGFGYDWGNPFKLNPEGEKIRDDRNLNWNISAPVGVAISWGICPKTKYKTSVTAFLSIIDVGSIANIRINGDSTVLKRTITISDIFSPGLSIILGIPKTPLCFSFGCVYKPQMLFDNKQSEFVGVPGMLRWNASLLVDIPIINFKTTEH